MRLQGTVIEEFHEDDEDGLALLTWQQIAENNFVTFESVIEEFKMVEPEDEEDKLPDQLLEVADTILHISLGIKSVKSHKEDFERLLTQATSLVVVFWQLYDKEGIPVSMWPPPYLRESIDRLVNTVYFIHKFMKRKSQESFTKRIVVGYLGLRDLDKFKKYQRKLGSVASGFESKPNNANIKEILVEIIKNRAQLPNEDEDSGEDEDNQLSEETAGPVRRRKRADQKASAEHSRQRKGKAKKKTGYQEPDDDVGEGTSRQGSRTNNAAQAKSKRGVSPAHDDEEMYESMYTDEESDEEIPIDDPPAPKEQFKKKSESVSTPKQKVKSTPMSPQHSTSPNNGAEGGTSRQGSRTNNAARSKTKKRASPVYDDDEEYDTEIPVVDPVAPESQSKKKKKKKRPIPTPKQKVGSPPPQFSNSFSNGSGNMVNSGIGNFYDSTVKDAFNDNSVNTFGERRKPA